MYTAYDMLRSMAGVAHTRAMLIVFGMVCMGASTALAQTSYSCFPNCDERDGRMLVLAGAGTNTLAGDTIVLKITSASIADSVEIGIYDGESGGHFDNKNVPLIYTLYADPAGDGRGRSIQIARWSGATMRDTSWTNFRLANDTSARAPNGNYIYALQIHNSDPSVAASWSGFKVRTDGAIALKGYQSFAVFVPMANMLDAGVIYPSGISNIDNTTYDGTWSFYLDVPVAASSLAVWDGDMDFGLYNCDTLDTDDPDTPNDAVPSWARNTPAVRDTIAVGSRCYDANGVLLPGFGSGSPPDDNLNNVYARRPMVWYEIVHPDGTRFANRNPSGNLEWEQFKISTATYDRSQMDYHADSLPAGIYQVRMYGMDLHNLNAWRFFNDALGVAASAEVLGVNASGAPVRPLKPYDISGTIYYDNDADGVQDADEPGIPSVRVFLFTDVNGDNVIDVRDTTETNASGVYLFTNVYPGTHTVQTDRASMSNDVVAVSDNDGTTSANTVTVTAGDAQAVTSANFGYKRTATVVAPGVGTRGYWTNHPNDWPVDRLTIAGTSYSKDELLGFLKRPTKGDATWQMVAQLIAARLNVAAGNESSCIDQTIASANSWLSSNPLGSRVRENSSAWQNGGEALKNTLDNYNNGKMCAEHMN